MLKRIIFVNCGSALFSWVICVNNVDKCFFRIRDRRRVEAIGSCMALFEVNLIGELSWKLQIFEVEMCRDRVWMEEEEVKTKFEDIHLK